MRPGKGRLRALRLGDGNQYSIHSLDAARKESADPMPSFGFASVTEPAPEVGWDTLFEGLASAAAPEIGNKASGAVEKVVAPVLGKAAPLAGKVAGSTANP